MNHETFTLGYVHGGLNTLQKPKSWYTQWYSNNQYCKVVTSINLMKIRTNNYYKLFWLRTHSSWPFLDVQSYTTLTELLVLCTLNLRIAVTARVCGKVMFSYCLSVQAKTFECLDIETSFLVWWYILIISRSNLSTNVIGLRSRPLFFKLIILTVKPQIRVLVWSSKSKSS